MKRVFTLPERVHGSGPVFFTWQRAHSKYLVTTGYDNTLNIFDRHGEKQDQINLPGLCTGLAWDNEGEHVGVITDRSPVIMLWDAALRKTNRVDTGVRDVLSIILWAKKSAVLAVGTSKGNVLIYDHRSARKIPILGKHTKRICSGAWSDNNLLALVGEERVLSINSEEGDTICEVNIKGEASLLKFVSMKMDDKQQSQQENCVSMVLNKKSLSLVNINDNENVHPLHFDERHGNIIDYFPYQDGYLMIGFASGLFTMISTSIKSLGSQLKQFQVFKESIHHFAICKGNKKLAVCNDNVIKVFETHDLEDVKSMLTVDDEKSIDWMEWSDDGQLLSLASNSGAVHVYLTRLNIIGSCYGTRLAYLSSLLEVTVLNINEDVQSSDAVLIIRVDIEPQLLAIGPYHVVAAMNNRCWFYAFTNEQILLKEKEYLAIIKCLQLNADYIAILFTDGKCLLHLIEATQSADEENKETKTFECDTRINCIKLNDQLFVYATESGSIEFFLLEDWTMVNVYRHENSIKSIECDANGLRLIFIDDRNDCFLINAITDQVIQIDLHESAAIKKIIWDQAERSTFILIDTKFIYVYSYSNDSINGECVNYVDKDKLVAGQYPLLVYNGVVVCQTDSGKTSNFVLSTHQLDSKNVEKLFRDLIKLKRYSDAFRLCLVLNEHDLWIQLAEAAMQTFHLEIAIKVFKHLNEIGFIESLRSLLLIEERNLLAANILMYLNRFDEAQQLFLNSSQPLQALQMRQSIHDWNEALILARRLSPDQIPIISREYANQLEFVGDYQQALHHFEQAIINDADESDLRAMHHNELCEAGIARNSLRIGNTRKGIEVALKYEDNQQLCIECASILEKQKLYSDAASMYEHGKQFNKCVQLYLLLKQMQKVEQLLPKINLLENKELINAFAKHKEQSNQYKDAMQLYKSINDEQNAVRLLLDKMNSPNEAIQIYKQNKSLDVAKMIARFFQRINDITSAIEFLCLSKCNDEAFKLASQTGQMDIYANILLNEPEDAELMDDYQSIAIYYEQEKNQLMAGKFNCLNEKSSRKGVKQLVAASQLKHKNSSEVDADAVNTAINALSKFRDEQSIKYLINYLLGELDGQPKDFKYLFRLYMKLGEYKDAAKTSLIIANEQQNIGQYKNSHQLLFQMCKELKQQRITIPSDMLQYLQLIHSYLLIKVWIKLNDAVKSSQLLIRCCSNLSKFPLHSTELLTTAVIQCLKAGFKSYAFQFAKQLIQMDQYSSKVDSKYKRKIEAFVRKFNKEDINADMQVIGLLTPCPFCGHQLLETELNCSNCRQLIDFCSSTGFHLIQNEIVYCAHCQFPSNQKPFELIREQLGHCLMCNQSIN